MPHSRPRSPWFYLTVAAVLACCAWGAPDLARLVSGGLGLSDNGEAIYVDDCFGDCETYEPQRWFSKDCPDGYTVNLFPTGGYIGPKGRITHRMREAVSRLEAVGRLDTPNGATRIRYAEGRKATMTLARQICEAITNPLEPGGDAQ